MVEISINNNHVFAILIKKQCAINIYWEERIFISIIIRLDINRLNIKTGRYTNKLAWKSNIIDAVLNEELTNIRSIEGHLHY